MRSSDKGESDFDGDAGLTGSDDGRSGRTGGEGDGGTSGEKKPRKKGRILIMVGVSLVVLGLLTVAGIYSYIHYTNRKAAGAQDELFRRWEEEPASPEEGGVDVGDGIARIVIPRLDLDAIVVELSSLDDVENLNRGPGHVPETAYPGQPGNMVISGHRTTYGAPFRHLEQLEPGDEIILMTAENTYVYEVNEQLVVSPADLSVLEQGDEARVTLTACHPWYSDAQRIVVTGKLVETEKV